MIILMILAISLFFGCLEITKSSSFLYNFRSQVDFSVGFKSSRWRLDHMSAKKEKVSLSKIFFSFRPDKSGIINPFGTSLLESFKSSNIDPTEFIWIGRSPVK